LAQFSQLAGLAEQLAAEASRLKKRAAIAESVARVANDSVEDAGRFCLYLAGQAFAEADPRKLNAGGALLTRAVKEVSGCGDAELAAAYRRHGDLGAAAAEVWGSAGEADPSTAPFAKSANGFAQDDKVLRGLTLVEVADAFAAMASARTTAVRFALVEGLLRRATALEAKYLLKLMLGDMRIGVKQSLIEEAIAVAAGVDVAGVRHAVMLEADLASAVERAFAGTLGEARMRLFHPLGFMLASPVETPEEAVERFTEKPKKIVAAPDEQQILRDAQDDKSVGVHAFLEDKYDGMRAQVHCGDPSQPGRVAIYSRNREEITESFPEIAEAFAGVTEPLIVDGELLGWDFVEAKALPFSVLGQRIGRKRVDDAMRRQIPVVFMAFDLLFEGGELLLPLPLRERRMRLEAVVERLSMMTVAGMTETVAQGGLFAPVAEEPMQRLMLSPAKLVESADAIDAEYNDARARANEGVMLKAAGSAYQPGRRGLAWVKLKRELATLDVVITGAEFGHGRRAGLLSDYTFAVRDEAGELRNVGKAYSGVTDAEIAELTEWLKAHTLEDHGHFRTVEPLRVLEVAFNNVMRSDRHSSGFALRFPRILRIRDDKPLEEIDTVERVEEIFQSQPDKGRDLTNL
jgi:DNA ligase-1